MCVLGTALLLMAVTLTGASRVPASPRMKVPDEEALLRRTSVPDVVAVLFGQQPDSVLLLGRDRLTRLSFQAPPQRTDNLLSTETCPQVGLQTSDSLLQGCRFDITLGHLTEQKHVFLCANADTGPTCCSVDPAEGSSGQTLRCLPSPNTTDIIAKVRNFPLRPGEASLLIESGGGTQLLVTSSGSQEKTGLYMLGRNFVSPPNKYQEQHYVKLVLIRRQDDPLQDKVLAFYKERNTDQDLYGQMWVPYVSQVCLSDIGGSKLILQFTWTSQMNTRLFCGDPASKQHFPELVAVATLPGRRWEETRVYALFRNQWNISAVCVYTLADIEQVFQNSPFKDSAASRPRECVPESTSLSSVVLRSIEQGSELRDPVQPLRGSSPLVFRHHSYTHISVDPSWNSSHFQVLYLTLHSGGVHKVLHSNGQIFIIAAYQPFSPGTRVLGTFLHPDSKMLLVHSSRELVQLDVARCSYYGRRCEDCVLARDPDCGWDGSRCTPGGGLQDVSGGDHSICSSAADPRTEVVSILVPPNSPFFLQCPMTSHHAQYVWLHPEGPTTCSSREEQCLLLMDHMTPSREGYFTCQSTEEGYIKVIRRYHLKQNRGSWHSHSPLLWTLLMAAWTVETV